MRGIHSCLLAIIMVTPALMLGPSTSAADDFATRCGHPSVVRCFSFDSQAEAAQYIDQGQQPSAVPCDGDCAKIVTNVKASGNGSLRFELPSNAPADSSGSFHFNFTPNSSNFGQGPYPVQFDSGDEFYVQWRQRFSPEFLQEFDLSSGSGGWKQAIIGEGDRPGEPAYSCTQLEIVTQNTSQYGMPQLYHSCGSKDSQYEALYSNEPGLGWLLQNVVECRWRDGNPDPHDGDCVPYVPNEWMTFQVHVAIGTWYQNDGNYSRDSTIELWVAREGEPSRLVISFTDYDIANTDPDAKYGKVWLLPFHTGKSSSQAHATAYTWYDELIVATSRIADADSSPSAGAPRPPTDLTAN